MALIARRIDRFVDGGSCARIEPVRMIKEHFNFILRTGDSHCAHVMIIEFPALNHGIFHDLICLRRRVQLAHKSVVTVERHCNGDMRYNLVNKKAVVPRASPSGFGSRQRWIRCNNAKERREYLLRRSPRESGHNELSKARRLDGKSLDHRS